MILQTLLFSYVYNGACEQLNHTYVILINFNYDSNISLLCCVDKLTTHSITIHMKVSAFLPG